MQEMWGRFPCFLLTLERLDVPLFQSEKRLTMSDEREARSTQAQSSKYPAKPEDGSSKSGVQTKRPGARLSAALIPVRGPGS